MRVPKSSQLTKAAICLGLCFLLPFLTGQIPQIGNMLCPMHIPVLLCGFLCGPSWAFGVGFLAPLLRSLIFSTPVLFPTAIAMMFELATYGLLTGILYRQLPKTILSTYGTLLIAMAAGRIVSGLANWILFSLVGNQYTWALFFTTSFVKAVPGILLQIVLIPILVLALRKAKIIR